MDTKGEKQGWGGGGGMNWEFGIGNIYTNLYKIDN